MKINKLMLALAVAATTIAACNKQETTPVVENQLGNRSIVLNLANVMPATKGTGKTIADGTQVKLNSYQVFFVGQGDKIYAPKTETAEEYTDDARGTYFNTGIADNDGTPDMQHQFHFLPQHVNTVVVLGNAPMVPITEGLTYDDVMAKVNNLRIENQQDPNDLLLYGMDASLEKMTAPYDHETGETDQDVHPEPLFKAVVNLRPTVARFEVTGFQYAQEGEDERLFSKISVDNLSVINWHNAATVALADDAITVTASTVTGDDENPENPDLFFGGFYNDDTMYPDYLTQVAKTGWNFDAISTVELTKTNPLSGVVPTVNNDATIVDCYSYHVFPGANPRFIAELTGVNNVDGTDITTKMYLQTINEFAPAAGKIYRMCLTFTDNDLRAAEKCIQVEIHVADWDVEIVTPTFGKDETTETPETPAE